MATTYVIQSGDTLWSIAQQFYGDGDQANVIHEANRSLIGPNPDAIQAGWSLTIPDRPTAPGQSYVTTDTDTLWNIAARFYGDGAQWPKIYQQNTAIIGANPNILRGDLTLHIPAAEHGGSIPGSPSGPSMPGAPAQQIVFTSPPPGTIVGSPVVVTGRLARLPFQSNLGYRFVNWQGLPLGEGLIPVSGALGQPTSFNASLTFTLAPSGGDIRLDLFDQNADNGVIAAMAALQLRVAPQPQQITFTSPLTDTVVGSPIVITGHTMQYPSQGTLGYRFVDSRGGELGRGAFPVSGAPGQGAQFNASLTFILPPQGGPVRVELFDQNSATGVIIGSAALQVQVLAQQSR